MTTDPREKNAGLLGRLLWGSVLAEDAGNQTALARRERVLRAEIARLQGEEERRDVAETVGGRRMVPVLLHATPGEGEFPSGAVPLGMEGGMVRMASDAQAFGAALARSPLGEKTAGLMARGAAALTPLAERGAKAVGDLRVSAANALRLKAPVRAAAAAVPAKEILGPSTFGHAPAPATAAPPHPSVGNPLMGPSRGLPQSAQQMKPEILGPSTFGQPAASHNPLFGPTPPSTAPAAAGHPYRDAAPAAAAALPTPAAPAAAGGGGFLDHPAVKRLGELAQSGGLAKGLMGAAAIGGLGYAGYKAVGGAANWMAQEQPQQIWGQGHAYVPRGLNGYGETGAIPG